MTKTMMNRKGLSSVIGAVLLILISVGAATSAWTFISEISGQTQDNIEDKVEREQLRDNSEISIDLVYNSTDGYSVLDLGNSGSTTITLRRENGKKTLNMYLDGRPEEWTFTENKDTYVALEPRNTVTINTTREYPPEGEEDTIELIGPYDTSTTYICYNSGTASC